MAMCLRIARLGMCVFILVCVDSPPLSLLYKQQVHGTAGRINVQSTMKYRPTKTLFMGGEKHNTQWSEFEVQRVSEDRVKGYIKALSTEATDGSKGPAPKKQKN